MLRLLTTTIATNVKTATIRYYEQVRWLPRPARATGRRVYDEGTIDRLQVIGFAERAGSSLRHIRRLFDGFASDTPADVRWQNLATTKLAELDALV